MKLNPQLLRLNRNLIACCVISALISAFVAQMLSGEENKLIKKELIKLASSFGIGEIVYLGIRWSLMFYFLEVGIEPFVASLVSEAIATTFYLAVVSTVLKVTKVY